MYTSFGGKICKSVVNWWRGATQRAAPCRPSSRTGAAQKLPLIADIVARAGREPLPATEFSSAARNSVSTPQRPR
jgi:hypothetical protein